MFVADGTQKNAPSAGISADETDVAAVFERLKAEVRGRTVPTVADGSDRQFEARLEAERLWAVAVDTPIERRPGLRGRLAFPVKRLLRKLMSWYVGPFAADQRAFNAASLRMSDELRAYVDETRSGLEQRLERPETLGPPFAALERQAGEAGRMLRELEERVLRLERLERRPPAPTRPAASAPRVEQQAAEPDYFAFESRMRGSTAEVREKQQVYVEDFRECAPVLDIGCGRGEFLQLLRDAGIEARGIDVDPDMVAFCVGEGLDVAQQDAVSYLEGLPDGALGGIFSAHVLEHLPTPVLIRVLELAHAKLRPGGLFAAETPNPRTLVALSTFAADLSHVRPLHPDTLAHLARYAGFAQIETRYLNAPPAEGRLRPVPLPDDPSLNEARASLEANVDLLNEVVFGPQDFAVLARA